MRVLALAVYSLGNNPIAIYGASMRAELQIRRLSRLFCWLLLVMLGMLTLPCCGAQSSGSNLPIRTHGLAHGRWSLCVEADLHRTDPRWIHLAGNREWSSALRWSPLPALDSSGRSVQRSVCLVSPRWQRRIFVDRNEVPNYSVCSIASSPRFQISTRPWRASLKMSTA